MRIQQYLTLFVLIAGLSLTAISCSDDPSSTPDEEPPEMPTFENIQPELSYFEANISTDSPAYIASVYASSFSAISQMGMGYTTFFAEANREEADFEGGTWVWEYSYNWEGESVQIVLESEERANETYWSMTWDYDGSDSSFEDYTMVEGTVAHDGLSGSWRFNTLDEQTGEHWPLLETTWNWQSETRGEIKTEFYEEGDLQATYTFVQDGPEHTLTMVSESEDNDIVIYWNEDTGNGYFQEGEEQKCWDETFEEVEC